MTFNARSQYCLFFMEHWQYKAAFVIQFRPETDIAAGRIEGKVEHIASTKTKRFHSIDELVDFIANLLAEVRGSEKL